jgi:hypothetical protein
MKYTVKNKELVPLFNDVLALMKPYEVHFSTRTDVVGYYDLWSEKDVVIDGREKDSVYFAGLVIQKSYVGFYFMPIYADTDLKELFGPKLISLLKGKSCFHIKELDVELIAEIKVALKYGLDLYVERGWV